MWLIQFLLLFFHPALASNNPSPSELYQNYKNDYYHQYNQYQSSLNQYNEKKQIDLKYKSITTQNEKNEAFIKAFVARNQSLETYCRALRVKLEINKTYNQENTQKIQDLFSSVEKSLINDNQNILKADSTNNKLLAEQSQTFDKNYDKIKNLIEMAIIEDTINYNLALFSSIGKLSHDITQNNTDNLSLQLINAINNKTKDYESEIRKKSLIKNDISNQINTNSYASSLKNLESVNQNLIEVISELKSLTQVK